MDAIVQGKVVELLKDGNRPEPQPNREGTPGTKKCENGTEPEDGAAEWSGVRRGDSFFVCGGGGRMERRKSILIYGGKNPRKTQPVASSGFAFPF